MDSKQVAQLMQTYCAMHVPLVYSYQTLSGSHMWNKTEIKPRNKLFQRFGVVLGFKHIYK